jgi:serine/threonine protein kinase
MNSQKMVQDRHLSEGKNGDVMDIEIGKKIGEACPYLVKFYGALHGDVSF